MGRCCRCCPESLKAEFQRRKFGLGFDNPFAFYCCQFRIPFVIFVIFKAMLAIYTLVWLIIFLDPAIMGSPTSFTGQSIYVFLTSWAYLLLVIYLWTSLLLILCMTYKHVRNGDLRSIKDTLGHVRPAENTMVSSEGGVNDSETGRVQENVELLSDTDDQDDVRLENCSVPDHSNHAMHQNVTRWYHKIVWVIHDMTSGVVCMVTLIYFSAIYPYELKHYNWWFVGSILDINLHGITSVLVLLDNMMSAIPVRILHVIYPMLFGTIYIIFTLIYYSRDPENNIPYVILLDWNHPGTTIGCLLFISIVLMPTIQIAWFGFHRLKLRVFHKIHGYSYETSMQAHSDEAAQQT